jgi:hypothetical protein
MGSSGKALYGWLSGKTTIFFGLRETVKTRKRFLLIRLSAVKS